MTTDDHAVLVTRAAYEADASAWADRRRDGGFLAWRYQRFRDLLWPGARVLDLGCGPGIDAGYLAGLGLEVTGIDLTRSMLQVALGRGQVRALVEGDCRHLPFKGSRFDGVWASASLLHLPKAQVGSALREARRILTEGGLICTSMKMGDWDGIMTQEERGGGGAVRGDRYFAHYGPAEWLGHLRAAGFEPMAQHTFDVQAQRPNTPWLTTFALARASPHGATRLHAAIKGRVQGVGFRFFVERQANALGLSGWVRNLPDGSVELLAEGDAATLDKLLADVHRGPRHAAVDSVDAAWSRAEGSLRGFGIRA